MNTFQEIEKSYERLQSTLHELLGNRENELTINQKGDCPLLILETKSDSAGFTIVNGTPDNSYNSAYNAFKKLYRDKHDTWNERNLSFIVCSQNDLKKNEKLFNLIESDAYFCRKYVLRFPEEKNRLEQELRRLPFLPLDEDYPKDVDRPISAQSLLQNLGISATLSRHLIESGKRSAIGIIEDLIEVSNNLPEIENQDVNQTDNFLEPIEKTRIKNISIEGFRAYGKKQIFNLDVDIVVLYGPNGLGKTSFFDAIDFVTTGRVGRLSNHYRDIDSFQSIAQNLATSKPGKVKIEINQGDNITEVYREIDDWSYAIISDEKFGRKDTIQKLTLANWGDSTERIEILERLFRATHLFSQSNPEFFIDFESNSKLPSDLVSRTLAMEDYASGLSKVKEILTLIGKRIKKRTEELNTVQSEINDLKQQMDELPNPEKEEVGPKLEKMTTEIINEIQKHTDIDIEESEITKNIIREWRSLIDAELANSRESLKRLKKIESEYPQYESQKKNLNEKTKRLEELNSQKRNSSNEKKRLEKELEKLEKKLAEEKKLLNASRTKNRVLSEFRILKEKAGEVEENLEVRRQNLTETKVETSKIEDQIQKLESDIEKLNTQLIEAEDPLDKKTKSIDTLSKIEEEFKIWNTSKDEINKIQTSITKLELDLKQIEESFGEKQNLIKEHEEELFKVEKRLEKLTSNKAELSRLLDDIESYINDGKCPVCGVNHDSKELLLEKIHQQKENRPEAQEELVKRSQDLKRLIKETNELKSKLVHSQEVKYKELNDLSERYKVEQEKLTSFESSLEQINLSINEDKLRQKIKNFIEEEKTALTVLQNELKKKKKDKSTKEKQIKQLQSKNDLLIEVRKRTNSKIEDLKKQMEDFYLKAEELDIPLDINSSELKSIEEEWIERESKLEKKVEDITQEKSKLKEKNNKFEKSIDELSQNSEMLIEQIENLQFELENYEDIAYKFFENKNFDLESISELRAQSNERVNDLQRLVHQILTFERALDSVELSAMVVELESNIEIKSNRKEDIEERLTNLKDLKKWFSDINDVLNNQNRDAVENHVKVLGPLSSLIQKRLRSVYGFGDISLHPSGNEIKVDVDWNGKKVKPTDYFSDSQKQILMFSLFMSGRLTQTWSGFAPILLDDPVTHFDDLNAFGFVELIRGLISTNPGKRQFIISTCEERLFELMRNKFGRIEGGAKFYRFQCITESGPVIEKIEA